MHDKYCGQCRLSKKIHDYICDKQAWNLEEEEKLPKVGDF